VRTGGGLALLSGMCGCVVASEWACRPWNWIREPRGFADYRIVRIDTSVVACTRLPTRVATRACGCGRPLLTRISAAILVVVLLVVLVEVVLRFLIPLYLGRLGRGL
jgi:hypothetical protein